VAIKTCERIGRELIISTDTAQIITVLIKVNAVNIFGFDVQVTYGKFEVGWRRCLVRMDSGMAFAIYFLVSFSSFDWFTMKRRS